MLGIAISASDMLKYCSVSELSPASKTIFFFFLSFVCIYLFIIHFVYQLVPLLSAPPAPPPPLPSSPIHSSEPVRLLLGSQQSHLYQVEVEQVPHLTPHLGQTRYLTIGNGFQNATSCTRDKS